MEGFVMWRWRRMEEISWADLVRNAEVLKKYRNKSISYKH
jgi:hypothetical protein